MILAVGNSGSYEVDSFLLVQKELEKRGTRALLFQQDKCLKGAYLDLVIENNKDRVIATINGVEYDIDNFSAIWMMKPFLPKTLMEFNPPEYRQFINRQFRAMRVALWSIFQDKIWISDPWATERAENKPLQLHLAAQTGFLVPDTLITSDPEKVRAFFLKHGSGIVTKQVAGSPMLNKVIYTNVIGKKEMEKIDSLRMSPAIFQQKIPKAFELRITVAGDNIYPAKIYSQDDPSTALDWRRLPLVNDYKVKMETTSIPDQVTKNIKTFMTKLGLRFGCIDMIVTPTGEYVFLEINPNGQWYFVQLATKQGIASSIADLLTQK